MKQNWLIHDNTGPVDGGAGSYLVVLGQYGAVLPCWLVLGYTGSV